MYLLYLIVIIKISPTYIESVNYKSYGGNHTGHILGVNYNCIDGDNDEYHTKDDLQFHRESSDSVQSKNAERKNDKPNDDGRNKHPHI